MVRAMLLTCAKIANDLLISEQIWHELVYIEEKFVQISSEISKLSANSAHVNNLARTIA